MANEPDPLGHLPTVAPARIEAGPATLLDQHVGNRVRLRREMLGAEAKLIGRMAGLDERQLQRLEAGQAPFGADLLYKFARILEVPISWFYDGLRLCEDPEVLELVDRSPSATGIAKQARQPEHLATLAVYFEGLHDHQKSIVIDVARALSSVVDREAARRRAD